MRLLAFLSPFIVIVVVAMALAVRTGELMPVHVVAWLQMRGKPFIFLPNLSDHSFKLKQEAIRRLRPDILVLGSSRANQWRSAMFRPERFYNSANAIYVQRDFSRMLEELDGYSPRVIIFSIDYFAFTSAWEEVYKHQSRDGLGYPGSPEFKKISLGLMKEAIANPEVFIPFQTEAIHGTPALGLNAIKRGTGFRLDGSYQYGHAILGFPQITVQSAASEIRRGKQWPTLPGTTLGNVQRHEFERFVNLARSKNIILIGVTMPFASQVVHAIEETNGYDIWKEFQSPQTKDWIRSQGVIYFDFTRLESFNGRPDEFVDPFHPSEPAYIRMLLTMLRDPQFRAIFPAMDSAQLEQRLRISTRYESYRNEF